VGASAPTVKKFSLKGVIKMRKELISALRPYVAENRKAIRGFKHVKKEAMGHGMYGPVVKTADDAIRRTALLNRSQVVWAVMNYKVDKALDMIKVV
jgi:hypothetical protein